MGAAEAGQGENGLLGIFGCLKKEGLQTEDMLFRLFFLFYRQIAFNNPLNLRFCYF